MLAIYNSSHTCVASYSYDAWGNIISKSGVLADVNPFRYRSYYYDAETWFYYLQSRYYDPQICRFINANVFTSTGQGLLGNNMFAYCNNNPVNCSDPTGESASAIIGGAVAGALISVVSYLVSCGIQDESVAFGEFITAILVGGTTGTIGVYAAASGTLIELLKFCGLAGFVSASFTDGDMANKLVAGFVSAAGTYWGTYLPTDTSGKFAEMFTNYAATLFAGTPAEIVSFGMQQLFEPDVTQVVYPDISTVSNPLTRIASAREKGGGASFSVAMMSFSY